MNEKKYSNKISLILISLFKNFFIILVGVLISVMIVLPFIFKKINITKESITINNEVFTFDLKEVEKSKHYIKSFESFAEYSEIKQIIVLEITIFIFVSTAFLISFLFYKIENKYKNSHLTN